MWPSWAQETVQWPQGVMTAACSSGTATQVCARPYARAFQVSIMRRASHSFRSMGDVWQCCQGNSLQVWVKQLRHACAGKLLTALHADTDIVNCVAGHPYEPLLASSGIESNIKMWEPRPAGVGQAF